MPLNFWIDIESPNGGVIGSGPIATAMDWSQTQRLDRAGAINFRLPLDERAIELLSLKNYAYCRTMISGRVATLGAGIIDSVDVALSPSGDTLQVSGPDLLAELRRPSTALFRLDNTVFGPFNLILKANTLLDPLWHHDSFPATQRPFSLRFAYESILNALAGLAAKSGEHFSATIGERKLNWLGPVGNFESSGFVLLANVKTATNVASNVVPIRDIKKRSESWDLVNRVYLFGAGEGDNRLTIQAANNTFLPPEWVVDESASMLEHPGSQAQYGVHEAALSVKDIRPLSNNDYDMELAANALLFAGYNWMRTRIAPHITYDVDVVIPHAPIAVGQTVEVDARRYRNGETLININETLNVLEVKTSVSVDGIKTAGLTVSTVDAWPQSDTDYLVSRLNESIIMESHPQMGPSVDTISYDAKLDVDTAAQLRFWLGEETTVVNEVVVRFRVDPLQSSVKSVGGDAEVNLEIDLPSHDHAISAHTHDIPNHQHDLLLSGSLSPANDVGVSGATGGYAVLTNTSGSDIRVVTQNDTGGTTSVSGGGGTSATGGSATVEGEVDISGAIATEYGIFEESSANTLALGDITIRVNGAAPTNLVVDETGGWYSLDITPNLINAYNRPKQVQNTVSFSTDVEKTARILAQIERRTVIQSIANF